MVSNARRTFLYKLDANCEDFLPEKTGSEASHCMREHFAYLRLLHEKGDMVLFGLTLNPDPTAVGLCVFYADSEAEARCVMENDPLVARGLARATLYPFLIALQAKPAG